MEKETEDLHLNIKNFFLRKYGIELNEKELYECIQSMYYLGRAIFRYHKIKESKKNRSI
jgi:hypothetical protein